MSARLKIGISACFFHPDPNRTVFTGKTLQYVEQSIAHWVQSQGALALVIPSPDGDTRRGDVTVDDYAEALDGLVLEGGSDMWPGSYGEEPLRPEWTGDRIRDEYEIALLRAFVARGKPVLGVCRGLQVLNVAYGGTLYQDLALQRPGPLFHRSAQLYDRNHHGIEFAPGTRLAALYPGREAATVNSVHHQGIKDLAPGFVAEARAPDGVIEAIRHTGPLFVAGVQWHPEFHVGDNAHLLDGAPLLADFMAACHAAGGALRTTTTAMLTVTNPANGAALAELPTDNSESIARAFQRARAAQPAWASAGLPQRLACLRRFRDGIVRETERLAAILTSEVGKPIRQSRNELTGLLGRLDFFLGAAEATLAPRTVFDEAGMRERITHEPLGVVANISAWNYPYFVGANVFVPALAAGNCVLYKPSEYATLTGIEIGNLLHAAGVPQDAFQVIVGAGEAGAALLSQPVDGVFFTGSYATGARIAQAVGPRMIRLQLELGGKDPVYVCDDVDVAGAAASLADGAMYNTGQSCCSVERIYVHEKVHDAFIEAFVKEVKGYRIGDPTDESSYIGPLTRAAQLDVLEAQVADARAKGARLLTGGRRLDPPGHWFEPTVFSHVDHRMALMREESFGPIIGIQKVAGDDEAVRLMNDTDYGLTAGVYTRDAARAERLLAQVHAGSVYWNCCDRVSPRLPWSGVKHSGIGLTLSTYGVETFTRPKAWHLRSA